MGDIVDELVDQEMFGYTDEDHYPGGRIYTVPYWSLTPSERKIKSIRKELAIMINKGSKNRSPEQQNNIVNHCRRAINLKYGQGWRERGLTNDPNNQWTEEELKPFKKKKRKKKKKHEKTSIISDNISSY